MVEGQSKGQSKDQAKEQAKGQSKKQFKGLFGGLFKKGSQRRRVLILFLMGMGIFLMLTIIVLGVFVFRIDQQMMVRMKQRQMLQPTTFYSRTLTWRQGEVFPYPSLRELFGRDLRPRNADQRLFPGDYAVGQGSDCQPLFSPMVFEGAESDLCVKVYWNKGDHPLFLEPWHETLWLSAEFEVLGVFKGGSLEPADRFIIPPVAIAQYLGGEPLFHLETNLPEFPVHCLNAVMAIEDARFLEHRGISPVGLLRALVVNIAKGRKAQGGSTLTQQLIKNYFLTPEKTLKRKFLEFIMAILIEYRIDKDLILETYLNIIYMGQQGPYQVRGYGAAARYYFQKTVSDLTLSQCSLLAAIVNSPGNYNPFTQPDKARGRRALVLKKMEELNFITPEEKKGAEQEALPRNENADVYTTLPYFFQGAMEQAAQRGFADLAGYRLFTTLDVRLQELAQAAISQNLNRLETSHPVIKKQKSEKGLHLESSLIAAEVETGAIRALVGGRSFRKSQFNRALSAKRQAGSTFKPVVFLAALEGSNFSGGRAGGSLVEGSLAVGPLLTLKDEPFEYKYGKQKWKPANYDRSAYGKVPLYFALKESLNLATAQLGIELGLESIIETAQFLGLRSQLQPVPALTLGAFEARPIELTQVYLTLARFGRYQDLTFIESLVNSEGEEEWSSDQRRSEARFSAESVQVLVGMLKQTAQSGTARRINTSGFKKVVAGKTGTSNDYKDSWFIGFTPSLLTTVWTGYDDNTPTGLTGASGALPTWLDFMKEATRYDREEDFPWTEAVESRVISVDELRTQGFWSLKPDKEPDAVELIFKKESDQNE